MKWKIRDVEIDNQIVLAPMAGICDSAFRSIVKSMGCGLIETEMVSDKAIMHNNKKTKEMLYMTDCERPIAQQIFGANAQSLKTASEYIYRTVNPDIIDINMGCPVNKVAVRGHAGSALLKNPKKAYEIVKGVVETVPIPVTVKIRSGWDENSINALEIAELIEKAGASAITVHPRTRNQKYDVKSDWGLIKKIKENLSIPVIGNGDVKTAYDAKQMIDETSCDAVMIGRGVLGNPWLVKQCIEYLENGKAPEKPSAEEKIAMIKKHCELLIKNKGEEVAIPKMRTHAAYYLKRLPKTIDVKRKIFKANTQKELYTIIDDYYSEIIKKSD